MDTGIWVVELEKCPPLSQRWWSGETQRTPHKVFILQQNSACSPQVTYHSQAAADLQLALKVRASGKPNVYGLQIQLESNWNFELLDSLATSVNDREVVSFLRYGWPLNREMDIPLTCSFYNHKGALDFEEAVDQYLAKELQFHALVGPLEMLPWLGHIAISPMTTRPKKKSMSRRVLTDLSWPLGASVNDSIPRHEYYGVTSKVTYPTVDCLCKRAVALKTKHGDKALFGFKVDLNRAFCQIPTCPCDWSLLGTSWKGKIYFDKVAVMGSRTRPLACQRITNMIRHFLSNMGYNVNNFVDDFMGIKVSDKAWQAYHALKRLLRDLGVSEAEEKAVCRTQIIEFLGILFNLVFMTMEIPDDKVEDLHEVLQRWLTKGLTTRKQLEVLLGKLQFASTCVRSGRIFVARIIDELKGMEREGLYPVSLQLRKDVVWWRKALDDRNRVSMMWLEDLGVEDPGMFTDSCLEGMGAVLKEECIRASIPRAFRDRSDWSISHYEFLALIVAVQVWSEWVKGRRFLAYCDNQAVVAVVNTGKARDAELQKLLRWLCYLLTINDSLIRLKYVETANNVKGDLLSRSCCGAKERNKCDIMIARESLKQWTVQQHHWGMWDNW